MKILLVVDMQKDFINGSLGTPEAASVVDGVAARIRQARNGGETVFLTMDTHGQDYLLTQEGMNLPVPHCVKGTDGWSLARRVAEEVDDTMRIFEKPCFYSEQLTSHLARLAASQGMPGGQGMEIELCGLCTDICVVVAALAVKGALPEASVSLRADLCAGVTPEKHRAALEVMRSCQVHVVE